MEKDKNLMNNENSNKTKVESKVEYIRKHNLRESRVKPANPDELYERLINTIKGYHPSADFSMIEKAYHLSKEAHEGQLRKSGEPYIIHPLWVAIILAEIELDKESIVAGLLHDVVEDTHYSLDDISKMFSLEIAS